MTAPQWRVVIDCPCCGLPAEIAEVERTTTGLYVWIACVTGRHFGSLPADTVRRQLKRLPKTGAT